MASQITMLEMENVKLKEDNKKLTKRFGQKTSEDQIPPSLLKVCKLTM